MNLVTDVLILWTPLSPLNWDIIYGWSHEPPNPFTSILGKGQYDDKQTKVGLILGTGCNGAYLESADRVINWCGNRNDAQEVIVDPEFGAFGDNGCIDFVRVSPIQSDS